MKQFDAFCISIETLLKDFYSLHIGQRRYDWGSDLVVPFLEDILENTESDEQKYFIGTTILIKTEDEYGAKNFSVIDGQQRLTTILLIIAALKQRCQKILDSKSSSTSGAEYQSIIEILNGILFSPSMNKSGKVNKKYRLTSSVNDHIIFEKLILNETINDSDIKTISHENLINAYHEIYDILERLNEEQFSTFIYSLLNKVEIIRMTTPDKETAFTLFENVNFQLKELQPVDLLKNMLLEKTPEDDRIDRSKEWDTFINKLTPSRNNCSKSNININPNTFLKHYIMSQGTYINKNEIYEYFEKTDFTPHEVSTLLGDFNTQVDNYIKFLAGEVNDSIKNIKLLNLRQPVIVLLAAIKLNKVDFEEICLLLENVAFCYAIGNLRTNKLERYFTDIALEIKNNNLEKAKKLLNDLIQENKELVLQSLVNKSFSSKAHKDKAKYILLKIAKLLDGGDYSDLTLEHIMPEKKSTEWNCYSGNKWYDDPIEYNTLVSRIGNLTLLTKNDNSSIKGAKFDDKCKVYSGKLRLTSSLVEPIITGTKMTQFDKLFLECPYKHPTEWNKQSIEDRSQWIAQLAEYVWFEKKNL